MIDTGSFDFAAQGYVPGDGPTNAKLMFVGEAPAYNEIRLGRPFCGQAGHFLDFICRRANLPPRDLIYITNVIKVPAIDNEDDYITEQQIQQWDWMLRGELETIKPKVVASLGAWSTRWFLRNYSPGYPGPDLDWLHGVPRTATAPWGEFLLVPCYHPAAGLHDSDSIPKIYADLVGVRDTVYGARQPIVDTTPRIYYWDDEVDVLRYLQLDYIAVDTEGYPSAVNLISYSFQRGRGFVIRHQAAMREFVAWLQSYTGVLLMHNAPWDLRVLQSIGLDIRRLKCTIICTMQMAKYLNTEPGSLKGLSWRHNGIVMNEYMDIIRPIQRQFTIDYIERATLTLYRKPDPVMEWEKGQAKVKKPKGLNERLKRIVTDLNKNPDLDVVARWNKIPDDIRAMAIEWWGPMPQATLDHVDPEIAKNYSGQDADATLELYWKLRQRIEEVYGHASSIAVN